MTFSVIGWFFNDFVLMFSAITIGLLFGKIRIGKFSFGMAGTLFAGLFVGWFAKTKALEIVNDVSSSPSSIKSAEVLLSKGVINEQFFFLFLILFVSSVGLLASKDIKVVIKKYGLKFMILGFLITFTGGVITYGMTVFTDSISNYEIVGVYTGALTSSPGLAVAIENGENHMEDEIDRWNELSKQKKAELLHMIGDKRDPDTVNEITDSMKENLISAASTSVGRGYSIAYPFAVMLVILSINFYPMIFKINVQDEINIFDKEMKKFRQLDGIKQIKEVDFDLVAFIIACLFGYTIGKFKINLGSIGEISLGSTGGVLIGSLFLGYIGKIGFLNFRMNSKILGVIRQIGLSFFLCIVGIRYGYGVVNSLNSGGIGLILIAIVIGVVAMTIGFLVGRYLFKINWVLLSGAICGARTSTPGLGAAIEAIGSDDPAAGYGAAYPFALLGMVIYTMILYNLPM